MRDLGMTQPGTVWFGAVSPGAPQLRSYFQEADERLGNRGMLELFSVSQSRGVIPRGEIADTEGRADSFAKYKVVRRGDIVLNRFNAYRGSLGIAPGAGIVSPDYAVIRPVGADPRYFDYLFRSDEVANFMKSTMGGIGAQDPDSSGFSRIDLHKLVRLPVPFREEIGRVAVADFLDRETAKIDALIAKQEQLITTLDERRGAVISRAVTRGLVENCPLRESGLQWMPGIPKSWKTVRMPYAASVVSRGYQDEFELLSVYLNRGVIPYSEGGGLVHKPSEDLSKYQHVVPGDIVLNNQQAWRGSVGVSRHFGNVSPAYIVLRPTTDWHPGYLNYLLRSPFIVTQLEVASRGVGDIQRQLSRPWMREVVFPLPPVDEQERIANHLDDETGRIDQLRAEAKKAVAILAERRQALISAAVTGKLEVTDGYS